MSKSAKSNQEEEVVEPPIESTESEVTNYQEKYQRALADYQNLLKQSARDKSDLIKYGNEKLLNELLPVYDFLKISLAHSAENDPLAAGLKYVLQEFKKVLANAQVSEVETIGKSFDFHSMEAVETVETADEAQNDLVAKELQAGYRIFDKVVRPARVAVYKLSNKDSKEEN
jgi:molecular chaperone GrpE